MPHCDAVSRLTANELVQRVLYVIRNAPKTAAQIKQEVQVDKRMVQDALTQLQQYHLASRSSVGQTWEARIGVFSKEDIRVAQELGKKYGQMEAAILAEAAPAVREIYEGCSVVRKYPWPTMSSIILGGLIADFCVIDRAPFQAERHAVSLLPPLQPDGTRWEYTGFELDEGKIYPLLEWTFYHNLYKDAHGGFARWGCFEGSRAPRPSQPEALFFRGDARKIVTAISSRDLTLEEVCRRATLPREVVKRQLEELAAFDPPAIVMEGERFQLNVPILSRNDLAALLAKGDEAAKTVHAEVSVPYHGERERVSTERGLPSILPGSVLAREFALQRLFEEGILSPPASAPGQWNGGVWGWLGPLPLWEEAVPCQY